MIRYQIFKNDRYINRDYKNVLNAVEYVRYMNKISKYRNKKDIYTFKKFTITMKGAWGLTYD